jgi:peptide/nickel transport system permease protein
MKLNITLMQQIRRDRLTLVSLFVVFFWGAVSFLPVLFPELAYVEIDLPKTRQPPMVDFSQPLGFFGYDTVGSSILLQIINGAGVSLVVGCATVLGALMVGVPLGAVAGYFGGRSDALVGRVMDVLLAFPPLVLPLAIAVFFGGGLWTIIFALCAGGWIGSAKIVRAQFRALKNADFVVAATALGATPARIIFRHLLPSVVSPLTVHSTFTMAGAILAEAGLSFLGLGLGDGHVSWGGLLSEARAYLIESPHMAIFPSLSMLSLVLSLNFLGEALRVVLDPRQSSPLGGG